MSTFLYFAYGSNMLSQRLLKRCPSAKPVGIAHVEGYELSFTKRSIDGSGKANLRPSEGLAYGVVFEVDLSERSSLDIAEGKDYTRSDDFVVTLLQNGQRPSATTYLAQAEASDLMPYDWYHALVIAGAKDHGLPVEYIEKLRGIGVNDDPEPNRKSRREALDVLQAAGFGGFVVQMYFDGLFGEIAERAVELEIQSVAFADGSAPVRHKCHENVNRWVKENPRMRTVRGWLVTSPTDYGCLFDAHSVVASESGGVFDITLSPGEVALFIPHDGDEASFHSVADKFAQYPYVKKTAAG